MIAIIQTSCQIVMKNSQGKLVLVYMSLQFLSCLYLFKTNYLPTIVELVLTEMWNLINFSKYKPMNLWIFWSSVFINWGDKTTSFSMTFEMQTEKYENQDNILNKLHPSITAYGAMLLPLIISIFFCFCEKTRKIAIIKLKAAKKAWVWNGLLAFLDACYINYCLLLAKFTFEEYNPDKQLKDQLGTIASITIYIFLVFITQIIIIIKLK